MGLLTAEFSSSSQGTQRTVNQFIPRQTKLCYTPFLAIVELFMYANKLAPTICGMDTQKTYKNLRKKRRTSRPTKMGAQRSFLATQIGCLLAASSGVASLKMASWFRLVSQNGSEFFMRFCYGAFDWSLWAECYKLLNGHLDPLCSWSWGSKNGSQSWWWTYLCYVGLGGAKR